MDSALDAADSDMAFLDAVDSDMVLVMVDLDSAGDLDTFSK